MLCSLVICVFASFAIESHCQNAPPCTNEQLYGHNKNCFFVFDEWVTPADEKTLIPSAEPFGLGHLFGYRLAFSEDGYSTIVPSSSEDLWGYAFLTCIEEYEAYMARGTNMNIIAVAVKVKKKDGTEIDAQCNAFTLKNEPSIKDPVPDNLKPPASRLSDMLEAFKAVGIPSDYRQKIEKRFLKDRC